MVKVLVSMDQDLVRRLDDAASSARVSRSALISRLLNEGLRTPARGGGNPRVRGALARMDEVLSRYPGGPDVVTAVRQSRDEG